MTDQGIRSGQGPTPLAREGVSGARLSTLAVAAGAAVSIPLPWVPTALRTRIRGAVVHDVASRRGLSLTPAARAALAEPALDPRGRLVAAAAILAGFVMRRAVGRVAVVGSIPTVAAGLEVWALGALVDRYLDRTRSARTIRIEEHEARRLRAVIDRAIARTLSPELSPEPLPAETAAPEEMRDGVTQVVDRALLALASVPAWVERRLFTAFDAALADSELGRGA